ncbi:MAG: hypothetical protein HQ579_00335, partial [Candidatus Omnitrophica bacterium]|nr:hypothetical protein [Candidatus Omnitrophota bacterium]
METQIMKKHILFKAIAIALIIALLWNEASFASEEIRSRLAGGQACLAVPSRFRSICSIKTEDGVYRIDLRNSDEEFLKASPPAFLLYTLAAITGEGIDDRGEALRLINEMISKERFEDTKFDFSPYDLKNLGYENGEFILPYSGEESKRLVFSKNKPPSSFRGRLSQLYYSKKRGEEGKAGKDKFAWVREEGRAEKPSSKEEQPSSTPGAEPQIKDITSPIATEEEPTPSDVEGGPLKNEAESQGIRAERKEVGKRILQVIGVTIVGGLVIFAMYMTGCLDWYISAKDAIPVGSLFYLPGAALDAITGIIIWGTSDIAGQYINKGKKGIDLRQSLLVGSFGIFQGLGTHILLNIPDLLPILPWSFVQNIARTLVLLAGGRIISIVFARATSLGRKLAGIKGYKESEELKKTGEMLLVKVIVAPLKSYAIINILPQPIRVISEQAWDYLMTILSSYLMNRETSLITQSILNLLSKLKKPFEKLKVRSILDLGINDWFYLDELVQEYPNAKKIVGIDSNASYMHYLQERLEAHGLSRPGAVVAGNIETLQDIDAIKHEKFDRVLLINPEVFVQSQSGDPDRDLYPPVDTKTVIDIFTGIRQKMRRGGRFELFIEDKWIRQFLPEDLVQAMEEADIKPKEVKPGEYFAYPDSSGLLFIASRKDIDRLIKVFRSVKPPAITQDQPMPSSAEGRFHRTRVVKGERPMLSDAGGIPRIVGTGFWLPEQAMGPIHQVIDRAIATSIRRKEEARQSQKTQDERIKAEQYVSRRDGPTPEQSYKEARDEQRQKWIYKPLPDIAHLNIDDLEVVAMSLEDFLDAKFYDYIIELLNRWGVIRLTKMVKLEANHMKRTKRQVGFITILACIYEDLSKHKRLNELDRGIAGLLKDLNEIMEDEQAALRPTKKAPPLERDIQEKAFEDGTIRRTWIDHTGKFRELWIRMNKRILGIGFIAVLLDAIFNKAFADEPSIAEQINFGGDGLSLGWKVVVGSLIAVIALAVTYTVVKNSRKSKSRPNVKPKTNRVPPTKVESKAMKKSGTETSEARMYSRQGETRRDRGGRRGRRRSDRHGFTLNEVLISIVGVLVIVALAVHFSPQISASVQAILQYFASSGVATSSVAPIKAASVISLSSIPTWLIVEFIITTLIIYFVLSRFGTSPKKRRIKVRKLCPSALLIIPASALIFTTVTGVIYYHDYYGIDLDLFKYWILHMLKWLKDQPMFTGLIAVYGMITPVDRGFDDESSIMTSTQTSSNRWYHKGKDLMDEVSRMGDHIRYVNPGMKKKLKDAISCFDKCLKRDNKHHMAMIGRAEALRKLGRHDKAILQAKKVVVACTTKKGPAKLHVKALVCIGYCLIEGSKNSRGRIIKPNFLDGAKAKFEEALGIIKKHKIRTQKPRIISGIAYLNKCFIYYCCNDSKGITAHVDEIIEHYNKLVESNNWLSKDSRQLKSFRKTEDSLKEVSALLEERAMDRLLELSSAKEDIEEIDALERLLEETVMLHVLDEEDNASLRKTISEARARKGEVIAVGFLSRIAFMLRAIFKTFVAYIMLTAVVVVGTLILQQFIPSDFAVVYKILGGMGLFFVYGGLQSVNIGNERSAPAKRESIDSDTEWGSPNLAGLRKQLFGDNIDKWIEFNKKEESKERVHRAVEEILEDEEFMSLTSQEDSDFTLELIRYAVRNNICLGTSSLVVFTKVFKEKAGPDIKKRLMYKFAFFERFINFRAALKHPSVCQYLESDQFVSIPREDKLVAIVKKLKEIIPIPDDVDLIPCYAALPLSLGERVKKKDVYKIEVALDTFLCVREALSDKKVQEFLESDEFRKETPPKKRMVALIDQMQEAGYSFTKHTYLDRLYTALPERLSEHVKKSDIRKPERIKLKPNEPNSEHKAQPNGHEIVETYGLKLVFDEWHLAYFMVKSTSDIKREIDILLEVCVSALENDLKRKDFSERMS